jgi:predicted ATP-grasp superfamily ATP-dependent carboligase
VNGHSSSAPAGSGILRRARSVRTRRFVDVIDVAMVDADARQSLVTIRSLGQAGVRVGAFDFAFSPAFLSRWRTVSGYLPDGREERLYVEAIVDLARTFHPRALIPARDDTIEVLRHGRGEIESELGLALAPEDALAIAVNKERTLALASRLGIHVPISVAVADLASVSAAIEQTGLPVVVKPTESWVASATGGRRLTSVLALDVEEARLATADAIGAGGTVILQPWLQGSREAVSIFYADGRILARFAQVAHRMLPPLGGSSVVRESIALPQDLAEAAEELVRAAGLEGYSEVEFRRDLDGTPYLMEINPRLSASVEVAVRSGVDFPGLLYAWAAGLPLTPVSGYREGVRMRWLGGDIKWLGETIRQRGRPEVLTPGAASRAFASDCLTPYAYDYASWRDPAPAAAAAVKFLVAGPRRRYLKHRLPSAGIRGGSA